MTAIAELNQECYLREKELRALTKTFVGLEKPLKNKKTCATLSELVDELHNVFNSDRVNIEYVNHLLLSYKSNPNDWRKYAKFDRYRYTRNLVDEGNGKFNLLIICWGEGHSSPIHDHSDSHCFMKMLQGELCEVRYDWPAQSNPNIEQTDDVEYVEEELKEIGRTTMEMESVCYINDTLGLHRVENSSNTDTAVSLHLYCPPFDSCQVFNKKTGKSTTAQVTFWSKNGKRLKTETN